MKYKVVKEKKEYITLDDLKKDIGEFGASQVRNRCLVKKDNKTYRIIYSQTYYYLMDIDGFYLVDKELSGLILDYVIEELLTDGYEITYEK